MTLDLPPGARRLRPGTRARATIITTVGSGVLVDTAAIRKRGTTSTVTVDEHGTLHARRVTPGLASASMTVILAGLSAGDRVVIPDARRRLVSTRSAHRRS